MASEKNLKPALPSPVIRGNYNLPVLRDGATDSSSNAIMPDFTAWVTRGSLVALLLSAWVAPVRAQNIVAFSPAQGQAYPAIQKVIILGTGFGTGSSDKVDQVWFGDILLPSVGGWFTVGSDTQITAYVPLGAVTAPISVKRPFGPRVYSTEDFVVIGEEPYITGFSPSSGPGWTEITIRGVQFQDNVDGVLINGENVFSFFVQTDTRIIATAQLDVTTGPIIVGSYTTGGSISTEPFYVPPVIDGFSPVSGRAGETLTIDGINFTNTTEVRIGTVTMPIFNVNGNTQIVATVPQGAVSGKVVVWTPGGQYQTTTNFSLLPSMTGFTPQTGAANTPVTILGSNLDVPPVSVLFDGVAATVISTNYYELVATAPVSSSGHITVTTGDGTVTSSAVFYYPPKIASFSPGAGGLGTLVNIVGSSFTNATSVLFDGEPALFFTVTNNSLILAAAPNDVSTGLLTVTTPGGIVVSAEPFYGPATFTGFLPAEGFPGTAVTLFGENFEGASAIAFNGIAAPLLSNTGELIGTEVPSEATSGAISITTPAGTVSSGSTFVVLGSSDLRINTFLNVPNPVGTGEDLTLTIVPSNDGPNTASNVTASVTVPPGFSIKSASSTSPGITVDTNSNPVVFHIGTMSIHNNPTLTLVLVPQSMGSATNTVTLASSTFDPNTGNNTDARVTTVLPVPELSIGWEGASQVRIAWSVWLTNYLLQSSSTVTSNSSWSNVPTTPEIEGDERVVIEPSTNVTQYYRLKQ